ncbi:MAG: glycosyltransferase [Tepidisphaera sp.]|nr:glycosyltransferase [Tepidisphaera sp.]
MSSFAARHAIVSPMRVGVLELVPGGHRLTYVRRILPAFASIGEVTFITSTQAVSSEEYRTQIKPLEGSFRLEARDSVANMADPTRESLGAIARCVGARAVDHLVVPLCDGTIQRAGLARVSGRLRVPAGVEIEGLMMRGSYAHEPPRGLKERLRCAAWLRSASWAPFSVVHHLDRIALDWMRREQPSMAKRLRLMPDPVERPAQITREAARDRLGMDSRGRVIGCVGVMDERKGMDLLIRAFLQAELAPDDRLLLAGKHSPQICALIKAQGPKASERVVSIDKYMTEEELELSSAAMDVMATPYPPGRGHVGSSSSLVRAAMLERPVLSSPQGLVGDNVTGFGLGYTCDVTDEAAFARAIREALDASGSFSLSEAGRRFVEFNSIENFLACFTARARERAGLPPLPGARSWDWVMEAAKP